MDRRGKFRGGHCDFGSFLQVVLREKSSQPHFFRAPVIKNVVDQSEQCAIREHIQLTHKKRGISRGILENYFPDAHK